MAGPLEKVPVVWTLPSICHSFTEPLIRKTILKYAVDEAHLDTLEPYTSLAILSREMDAEGNRNYFINTWPGIWNTFFKPYRLDGPTSNIFLHETIPENHSVPIYIDVDIDFSVHGSISEQERHDLYQLWKQKLDDKVTKMLECIEDQLEKTLEVTRCFAMILNSHRLTGNDGKYSTHIIMHMKGGQTRFQTTYDLDQFLFDLINHTEDDVHQHFHYNSADYIYPYNENYNTKISLIDRSIYRRNGGLRLPFACKTKEPNRPMMPTTLKGIDGDTLKKNFFPLTSSMQECYFLASLVTYVPLSVTVTEFIVHKRNKLKRPTALNPEVLKSAENAEEDEKLFENLMDAINKQIPEEGQGLLTLLYVLSPGIVVFTSKSTYCGIRAGFHKSNHVFWVVLLKREAFYQRCFDEECMEKAKHLETSATLTTPTARGPIRYLDKHKYGEGIMNFLKRHELDFDKIQENAPKRARIDIRYYGQGIGNNVRSVSQRNIIEEAAISMDVMTNLLMQDVIDIFGD